MHVDTKILTTAVSKGKKKQKDQKVTMKSQKRQKESIRTMKVTSQDEDYKQVYKWEI